jgi:hypothetical protein
METSARALFNAAYTDQFYADFLAALERRVGGPIPYRVAETPFFVPDALRDRLAEHARGILDAILEPSLVERMKAAIPADFDCPNMSAHPDCVQIDFAVVRNADGSLDGKVVELQSFPSLYGMMLYKLEEMSRMLRERIPGLDRNWSIFYDGLDPKSYVERLREAVVAEEDPSHVILLDLHPEKQKTYPDFVATKQLLGVEPVCPSKLLREGNRLFRERDGKRVPVKRIFNRVVFDELDRAGLELPFRYTDDLDVTWVSHPNWYWVHSKYTLPFIDHPAVPRARTLTEMGSDLPEDLSRYVLKPLFSFAGAGVKVDVTRGDIDEVPANQRSNYLLQEKIDYHPGILMPDGNGVKAEVRMMFLRRPSESKPRLTLNLVRVSRGKMLGVDQNKNLTWVGGSVGLFDGPGQ